MEENETVVADAASDPEPAGTAAPDTASADDSAADDSANAAAGAGDAEAGDVADDPTAGSVPEVLKRVGDDPEAAREALKVELAKDEPRSTLVEGLIARDPTAGTVPEVLDAVGDNLNKARVVLEAELAKDDPRSTLVEPLMAMLDIEGEAAEAEESAPGGAAVVDPPAPSMTDQVQSRMVSSIQVGRELQQASKERNLETKRQQQTSLSRTNRPDNESKTQAELEND